MRTGGGSEEVELHGRDTHYQPPSTLLIYITKIEVFSTYVLVEQLVMIVNNLKGVIMS
jgi:hypothetical protein